MSMKRRASQDEEDNGKRRYTLAPHIVDIIRTYILDKLNAHFEADSWNENRAGVAWLSPEIGVFDELYRLYTGDGKHYIFNYNDFNTVNDVIRFLSTKSTTYLNLLLCYATNGGTNNPLHFELRTTRNIDMINRYFSRCL